MRKTLSLSNTVNNAAVGRISAEKYAYTKGLIRSNSHELALASFDSFAKDISTQAGINDCLKADILTDYSGLLIRFKRYDEALVYSRQATEFNPLNAGAWTKLGASLKIKNCLDDADDAFATALNLNKKDHAIWAARGELSVARGDKELAVKCYREAKFLAPKNQTIYEGLKTAKAMDCTP